MRPRHTASFLISLSVAALASFANPALAWWKSVHVSGCTPSPYAAELSLLYTGSGGGYYNYSSKSVLIQCATENSEGRRKDMATGVWIDVTDHRNNAEVTAKACTQAIWGAWGGSCGTASGSGVAFTGGSVLFPSLSAWAASGAYYDHAYIQVVLPPFQSTVGGSAFGGYQIGF